MRQVLKHIRKTLWRALDHDVFNTAKAAAYSGMLCFFPALLVMAAVVARLPQGQSLVGDIRGSVIEVLPPGSLNLFEMSMNAGRARSIQVILSATSLAVFAGLGVMLSLMEGFRRAYGVRRDNWGFWKKRLRALMLVPIVLLPLWGASLLLVFGHEIEVTMIGRAGHELKYLVLLFWRLGRWMLAVATAISVLSALYHFGTRRTEHWTWVLPGSVAAMLVWFPSTLAFGFYVTRVADYSRFYGSFAAGIATLVWLYLTSFSALLGAELNGVLYEERAELRP
ncbi:MAG TPA: YihY/virulence factor BrkB family protein [Terracidiphilus sp.]|jgi:membrane protein